MYRKQGLIAVLLIGLVVSGGGLPVVASTAAVWPGHEAVALEGVGQVEMVSAGPYLGSILSLSPLYGSQKTYMPAVAYNWKQREYLVVWHTTWAIGSRDIRAQRVSARGQLLGSEFVVFKHDAKDSGQPDVAYDPVNNRYLVVFVHDVSGNGTDWDVYGRFVPWNGPSAALTAFPICDWPTKQWNPKLAYSRTQEEFLVVWWTEGVGGVKSYVSGRRVRADGSGFPASPFAIASHPTLNRVGPDVAYNHARNEYLVVWDAVNASRDIYGVRLSGSGAVLGGGEFGIAGWPDNETTPAVAACSASDQYLVVWQSDRGAPTHWDIYGRFVKGDGMVDTVHTIASTTGFETRPHVACSTSSVPNHSGTQYLIAYEQEYANQHFGIRARFVSSSKVLRGTFALVQAGMTTDRTQPAVAGGVGGFLAVWAHGWDAVSTNVRGRIAVPNAVFLPLVMR